MGIGTAHFHTCSSLSEALCEDPGESLESFGGKLTSRLPRTKGVLWKERAVHFPGKNPTFTAFERLLERQKEQQECQWPALEQLGGKQG